MNRFGNRHSGPVAWTKERLWSWVIPEPNSGCWLWTGTVNRGGYARGGKIHRLTYEIFKGPIQANMTVDHICRVRCCINPDHLQLVTQGDNVRRAIRKLKTHCNYGHELTAENLVIRPKRRGAGQSRTCRICEHGWMLRAGRRRTARQRAMCEPIVEGK